MEVSIPMLDWSSLPRAEEKNVQNEFLSHARKLGYRVTDEDKTSSPSVISECNPNTNTRVTPGYRGDSRGDMSTLELMQRASSAVYPAPGSPGRKTQRTFYSGKMTKPGPVKAKTVAPRKPPQASHS